MNADRAFSSSLPSFSSSVRPAIAVIGMSGRFPGARNIEEFWDNLKAGRETITRFTDKELLEAGVSRETMRNRRYVKAKGIVEDIDSFDAELFAYPPREAVKMDPQVRLLHECAWEALEDAGYAPRSSGRTIGVFLGAGDNSEWIRRLQAASLLAADDLDAFLLNNRDYIATRISYKLDLKGPSYTVLTACSTSLVAIHLACQALFEGSCEMALAGGASVMLPWKSGYLHQDGLMVSPDGHCRAFDAEAEGTVFGDGAGIVVLKPLENALADGDHVRAVILGSAVNNDGNHKPGFTAPSAEGQAAVIRAAHRAAGVEPESLGCLEAHGTGTRLGDPIEFEALTKAFGTNKKGFCVLGSVKTNIGHVNVAAGISSFIKSVLTLENRGIPPTLHFRKPNPRIDLENSPFVIRTEFSPWARNGHPLRTGVSAFGFGGTNAHLVLQEAPVLPTGSETKPAQVIALSARTAAALDKAVAALGGHLKSHPDSSLADTAFTLAAGREAFKHRRAFVCRDVEEAVAKLGPAVPASVEARPDRSVVFLFPGQGAQYVNMGRGLYEREPVFRLWIDRAAEILAPLLGTDIRRIIHPEGTDPEAAAALLKQTRFAQPTIFAVSYALARLWMEWGIKPAALLGHSLGEYVAACLAGIFSLEDSLALVAERGEMMDRLPEGAMLAVPLPEDETLALLGDELSLAAVNAPALCVVSGPKGPVEALRLKLKSRDVGCRYLHTSHAFHSSMIEPLREDYGRMLEAVPRNSPQIPIISTVTGDWAAPEDIVTPGYWIRNARGTVRFAEAVRKAAAEPGRILLEIGPGRTLAQLARLNVGSSPGLVVAGSLPDPKERAADEDTILGSLGSLWAAGAAIDWPAFFRNEARRRVPLPTYPFERKRYWIDPPKSGEPPISRFALLNRKTADIADWFYLPTWKRSSPPPAAEKPDGPASWLVFLDALGLGNALVRRLRREGHSVATVAIGRAYRRLGEDGFVIDPRKKDDYLSLCADIRIRGRFPEKIVHLWNLTPAGAAIRRTRLADVDRALDLGFYSLLHLAQGFGKENITHEIRTFVVSNGLQDVTGSERIQPEKAPSLGPVKVIPQEYPNVKCCNIDIEAEQPGDIRPPLIERLMTEMRSDIPDLLVSFRGGRRWVQDFEPVRPERVPRETKLLKENGVYLITGGLGGIGLALAEFFAREAGARLILTGRTRLPARRTWDRYLESHPRTDETGRKLRRILRLERLGAKVIYAAADAADQKRMTAEIARAAARFGPIDGVVHAAGLPGEGILQLKRPEEAGKILAPKIHGTLVLDRILKRHHPQFIVLCSSVASVLGGIGLGDYCAANAFLDAFALRTRRAGTRVVAVDWDMWGQVGMGLKTHMPDELKEWFRQELRNGIMTREGIDVFRRILARTEAPNVIVSTRDLGVRIDLWIKREFIREKEASLRKNDAEPKHDRPDLETAFIAPETETEKKVAAIWQRLFGIGRIGLRDNFYELGGHSLLATTLLSHLRRELGANISIRDVLDHPTIGELGAVIDRTPTGAKPGLRGGEGR